MTKFETKLNQVRLALIISTIGKSFSDAAEAVEFLESILTARTRLGAEAALCIDMDIVLAKLSLGQYDEAKSLLDSSKERLNSISSSEAVVFSKFYGSTAQYHKV